MIKFDKTGRGFSIGEFTDFYDYPCSIQKSSLATEDAIWLGIDNPNPQIMASVAGQYGIETTETTGWVPYPIPSSVSLSTRMHLTRDQVESLIPVLQQFVDTGEVKEVTINNNPAVAAIEFALRQGSGDGMLFLEMWNEGEFADIRREWPDVPDSVFIGAEYGFESTK
jgi:hypothetical protein